MHLSISRPGQLDDQRITGTHWAMEFHQGVEYPGYEVNVDTSHFSANRQRTERDGHRHRSLSSADIGDEDTSMAEMTLTSLDVGSYQES